MAIMDECMLARMDGMIILKLKLVKIMMVTMMLGTRVEIEFDWPSARGAWQDTRPSELI